VVDPTLTISIDRSGMTGSLGPLEFSGKLDGTSLGIVNYQAPARQSRTAYAPDSINIHGSEAIGAAWQQAILSFEWVCDTASSETDVQAAYDEVVAALEQFSYPVTTQVSGAPAQSWAADMGSCAPSGRTYADLANTNPVYAVTIPVYPIPAVEEES
jgi:hypothetical protein